MAEVVNLNKARKAQAKKQKQDQAAANRITFGQSKAARDTLKQEAARVAKEFDGKKIGD